MDRIGQRTLYCDMPVPDHLMGCFKKRADAQIMGLEMLSIALGGLFLSQVRVGF